MHYQRTAQSGTPGEPDPRKGRGFLDKHGYRVITRNGVTMPEHRWVMQEAIGRPLERCESVHHKNGIRDDNRIENLELWVTTPHRSGQRVADLVDFVVQHYPLEVGIALSSA
jgi:hypothetical protein